MADQLADQVAELLGPARRRHADAADVARRCRSRGPRPARAVEAERHLDQPPPELRREVQARLDLPLELARR